MERAPTELLNLSRYRFASELQTRFSDMDINRHINNVAMGAAFEDARVRFDLFIGWRPHYAHLRLLVAAVTIDYLAEAHYPAPLCIHVGILAMGRTSWTLAELAVQDGLPRAICRATMVVTKDGKPTPIPADLRETLAANTLAPVSG